MVYLIKVCIDITVFYLLYKVLFQRLTSFRANRFYLLAIIGLSFGIPLLTVNSSYNGGVVFQTLSEFVVHQDAKLKEGISWSSIIETGYLLVAALLAMRTVWQLITLFRMPYVKIKKEACTIHYIPEHDSAFSFFHHVFIPESEYHSHSLVLQHELVHVKQLHSIDNLFMKCASIILWPFPLMGFISNELKQVHEYLADEEVCRQTDKIAYCELLVKQTSLQRVPLVHSFYQPLLKNRIMMITKNQKRFSAWKYLFILPVLVLAFLLTAQTGTVLAKRGHVSQSGDKPMPEKMPEYKGGQEALIKFLGSNLKYPEAAKKQKIEGRAVVKFTVAETGKVMNAQITRSSNNEEMDAEALRVVNLMPDWIPASDKGKNVACEFVLPVMFKLN